MCFPLLAYSANGSANSGSIRGIVYSQEFALPEVWVTLPGLKIEALTDFDGRFSIGDVPAGPYHITFGRIGYLTVSLDSVSVKPDQTAVLDTLVLNYHAFNLQEMVVTATRAGKKFYFKPGVVRLAVSLYEEEPLQ